MDPNLYRYNLIAPVYISTVGTQGVALKCYENHSRDSPRSHFLSEKFPNYKMASFVIMNDRIHFATKNFSFRRIDEFSMFVLSK